MLRNKNNIIIIVVAVRQTRAPECWESRAGSALYRRRRRPDYFHRSACAPLFAVHELVFALFAGPAIVRRRLTKHTVRARLFPAMLWYAVVVVANRRRRRFVHTCCSCRGLAERFFRLYLLGGTPSASVIRHRRRRERRCLFADF